ncbi:MAG: L,D-transpeptidase [Oscillospiraceae bacterium]|nr:L,D-transpeptidase [Oscillospiraceae bacterium]
MAYWIDISTSEHKLKLYDDSNLVKIYPIAVGNMLIPTPTGTYTIVNKQVNPGGPYGVLLLELSKPHCGIHGTSDPSSIGKNTSVGCIRMFNHDVLDLSSKARIGTKVNIHV